MAINNNTKWQKSWYNACMKKMKTMMKSYIAVFLSVLVAFALLPAVSLCAFGDNTEPTGTAQEMSEAVEPGNNDDGDNAEQNYGDTEEETAASEAAETPDVTTETKTEATTEAPDEVLAAKSADENLNISAKGWVAPRGKNVLSLTVCNNPDGTFFDLTKQAGQKLYGYDTLQGATAGNGYGYFTLYNRNNNHVIFVKVLLSEMRVVKVSAPLHTCHSNEITYNSRNNTIVVANSTPLPKRLTVINADTLTVMYNKNLKIKGKVSGMSKKQRKKFKGVGAIAYNEKHNKYVCLTRKTHDLLFLKANLKPYKRVKQKKKVSDMLYQGMDTYNDCIMICQSFQGRKQYNIITFYNMKGKYLARFSMPLGWPIKELETVFHDGNQFYAGFYSFYGTKKDDQDVGVMRTNTICRINNL